MVRPDDAAPPKGAPALEMDLPDLAGELDALSEKIHQLAEKERALSRRLACRSPKREAENGTLSWANRRKANLSDLKVAKKRNQDLEDFCDHWMAWLRGGTLRSGADAVAVCREQFLESVEAMLPSWGELTSRETQVAVTEAKVQLQVLKDRREEAVKHLKRSQELGKELRDIQAELQQQHLEIPSLYMAAMGSWVPEVEAASPLKPPVTQNSQTDALQAGFPGFPASPTFAWGFPPGAPWPWPPWTWQAPPAAPPAPAAQVPEPGVTGEAPRPAVEQPEAPKVATVAAAPSSTRSSTSQAASRSPAEAVVVPGPAEADGEVTSLQAASPDSPLGQAVASEEGRSPKPAPVALQSSAAKTSAESPDPRTKSPPAPAVCQVLSPPQETLRQVKLLLAPVGSEALQPSALRKLLRQPGSWYHTLMKATTPQDLEGAAPLELLATSLILLKGHMSSNLAEATAVSACADVDALRQARSPGGHPMAWQELLTILPRLREVSSKADFQALCKILAEHLLPRSRAAAPVRRLGEVLAQVGQPSGIAAGRDVEDPQSEESQDTLQNEVAHIEKPWRHFSEHSNSVFNFRGQMSSKISSKSNRPDSGDLSKMIRQDPAWQVAQRAQKVKEGLEGNEAPESESEIADVDDV